MDAKHQNSQCPDSIPTPSKPGKQFLDLKNLFTHMQ